MVQALRQGELTGLSLPANELALLEFAKVLTEHPARATDDDVARLRQTGWTEPQIAEAAYIVALFAFFNRVADAFGLLNPNYEDLLKSSK